jgi:hypothetical protein
MTIQGGQRVGSCGRGRRRPRHSRAAGILDRERPAMACCTLSPQVRSLSKSTLWRYWRPGRRRTHGRRRVPTPAITSCQIDRGALPSIAALSLNSRAATSDGLFATWQSDSAPIPLGKVALSPHRRPAIQRSGKHPFAPIPTTHASELGIRELLVDDCDLPRSDPA